MKSSIKKIIIIVGVVILICLAFIGWGMLFSQNPAILVAARARYLQAAKNNTNFDNGPCLGVIAPDWVLDIAHLPRQRVDDLPQNQCPEFLSGKVHHFVEMSPQGEVIVVE